MDNLQLVRKLSILTTIWSSLFLAIVLTNIISKSISQNWVVWTIYASLIGISFFGLKLWNKAQPEPLLDTNLTSLEMSISVILAVLVSLFGGYLMQLDSMRSMVRSLLLAFVMTTSQFTLLKVTELHNHLLLRQPLGT